jgi:uncharacterized protein YdeI (YjbR/CyaY-like superfamily)
MRKAAGKSGPGKSLRSKSGGSAKRFDATLERMRSRLNWTIIRLPFNAANCYGMRGQIRVKVAINGCSFRTTLFPTAEGVHILLVNKRMQKAARVRAGDRASFQMERDLENRVVTVPQALQRILAESRCLGRWYGQLNHSRRNDIAKWVSDPKSDEARVRRAEQIGERLLAVMDAERELPPILQVAFARNPRAREGWECMSKARRRSHLLGIFYYRTPAGREGRIGKMLEDALAIAEK